jgi:hypothetical protein
LYDLELEGALLQHAILVHGKAHGQGDVVVVQDFVVAYRAAFCATAVLGSRRVREVPLDKGSAVDERDVVEVDYLAIVSLHICARARASHSLAGATQTLAAHLSASRRPHRNRSFLTRRFLGTATTVSCAAKVTERRSVDMAHRTLAWWRAKERARGTICGWITRAEYDRVVAAIKKAGMMVKVPRPGADVIRSGHLRPPTTSPRLHASSAQHHGRRCERRCRLRSGIVRPA